MISKIKDWWYGEPSEMAKLLINKLLERSECDYSFDGNGFTDNYRKRFIAKGICITYTGPEDNCFPGFRVNYEGVWFDKKDSYFIDKTIRNIIARHESRKKEAVLNKLKEQQ